MNTDSGELQTVQEAKAQLRANFKDGSQCPCCNQMVKRYKRKIGSYQSKGLIALFKLDQEYYSRNHGCDIEQIAKPYFHVTEIFKAQASSGDFAKLVHWGLIEQMPNNDETKRTSGFWCITDLGYEFVSNGAVVRQFIYIYNQKFLGFDGPEISIKDALGEAFDYSELMNS